MYDVAIIDPVFSSGVLLAIMCQLPFRRTLDEVLRESKRRRLFQNNSGSLNRIMDVDPTFVTAWYRRSKEFLEVVLNPTHRTQIAAAVIAVLARNKGKSVALKWRMWLFYFFVYAQKFFAFSPRITFVPGTGESSARAETAGAMS